MARRSADLPVARASSIDGEAKVRYVHLDRLIPYARNARTHSPAQVAQIAASIVEFGWTNPVLADAQSIVAGHGRVLAARQLYDAGQDLRLPNGDLIPSGCVPVIDVDGWSEAKRRAYILADNQLALNAGWDLDLLRLELGELQADGFDVSLLGFPDMAFSAEPLDDYPALPDGEKPEFQQMTFTLHDSQAEQVKAAIEAAKAMGAFDSPNENSNGNALARICETFLTTARKDA